MKRALFFVLCILLCIGTLAQGQKADIQLLLKSADEGDFISELKVADYYYKEGNYGLAIPYLYMAYANRSTASFEELVNVKYYFVHCISIAQQGNAKAMCLAAKILLDEYSMIYRLNNGLEEEYHRYEGLYWAKKAYDKGEPMAKEILDEYASYGYTPVGKPCSDYSIKQAKSIEQLNDVTEALVFDYCEKNIDKSKYFMKLLDKINKKNNARGLFLNSVVRYDRGVQTLAGFYYAAELGYPHANYMVSLCDAHGVGLKNSKDARLYLQKAADENDQRALSWLGFYYYYGENFMYHYEKDESKALECYKKLADLGNAVGLEHLAMEYSKGRLLEKNMDKAVDLWKIAAKKGHEESMYRLATYFYEKKNVEAVNYLHQLANAPFAPTSAKAFACNKLNAIYRFGYCGQSVNMELADQWLSLAIKYGNDDAQSAEKLRLWLEK